MPIITESRRAVFRQIVRLPYTERPAYDSTPLYDHTSFAELESDIRIVSGIWLTHHRCISAEQSVSELPLAYFQLEARDYCENSAYYEMDTLFRVFVLKKLHGWGHETVFYEYLKGHPILYGRLRLKAVPDQSTLWHSWRARFMNALQSTVQKSARAILIKAQSADVTVPHEPEQILLTRGDDVDETVSDDRAVLSIPQDLLIEASTC